MNLNIVAIEPREDRLNRIHREQGILRDLMEQFPNHANKAMWQMYYDINFLLNELEIAERKSLVAIEPGGQG